MEMLCVKSTEEIYKNKQKKSKIQGSTWDRLSSTSATAPFFLHSTEYGGSKAAAAVWHLALSFSSISRLFRAPRP
jgi:hypothetical protein